MTEAPTAPAVTTDAPPVTPEAPPSSAPVSAPPGIFSDGLTFRDGWFNDVEDPALNDIRPTLAKFKSLPDLAKSYAEAQRLISQRTDGMVRIPGKEAPAEEVAAFRKAIGVPDSPDGYQIAPPANLPEGIEFRPETLAGFREFAHKHGIPNDVANALISFQAEVESQAAAMQAMEFEDQMKQSEEALRREWGPRWDQKTMLAKRGAETLGFGADSPLLQNPDFRRAMARAAEMISEDKLAGVESVSGTLSPGSEARDILNNPDNPLHKAYHDPSHPNHEAAINTYMQKMREQVARDSR